MRKRRTNLDNAYHYVVANNKVICLSTYAGKTVKGIAVCHENDNFNLDYGKTLAKLRCNARVADKREKLAEKKYAEALSALMMAEERVNRMTSYLESSLSEQREAEYALEEFLDKRN